MPHRPGLPILALAVLWCIAGIVTCCALIAYGLHINGIL